MGDQLRELLFSGDEEDRAVVEEATADGIQAAYDDLIEKAENGVERQARRYKQAARLIAPFQPGKAKEAYEKAVALDPTDIWSWIELGRLRAVYDSLDSAELAFKNGLQLVSNERDRMALHGEFGKLLFARGELAKARGEYEAASGIAETLAESEPGNVEWQRDLSVSYDRLGDVEVAAGNLTAARERFEAGLIIRENLGKTEPSNADWQRDLSVSYNNLGDVEVATGNLTAARERFEAGLVIAENLTKAEPGNAEWQRDLSVSYN
ncbi:MAG: hypothetical protein AAFQ27_01615, partial [Pseudomonadota bacterium]